jgi:hypothetical protein
MLFRIVIPGKDYSRHKNEFKEILTSHNLRWQGSFKDPWWGSSIERVRAVYDRDEERNMTISATLTWEGPEVTTCLEALRKWAERLGFQAGAIKPSEDERYKYELYFFEMIYKPRPEYLARRGRPSSWIEKDMDRWEEVWEQKLIALGGEQEEDTEP